MRRRMVLLLLGVVFALAAAGPALSAGNSGYEGQPGNQSNGHHGGNNGNTGYEGQPGNQGG